MWWTFLCHSIEIRGLGGAIFEFISAVKESKRFSEIILKYNYKFINKYLKFIFRNTNYIPLNSVQFGELDSTKIIEETVKKNKKLVDINQYFINQNTILLLFLKKPPRRRCHFKL